MIGNPNNPLARDSYASWELGMRCLREQGIRAGLYEPRPDNPDEVRWAKEGYRPARELDSAVDKNWTPIGDAVAGVVGGLKRQDGSH